MEQAQQLQFNNALRDSEYKRGVLASTDRQKQITNTLALYKEMRAQTTDEITRKKLGLEIAQLENQQAALKVLARNDAAGKESTPYQIQAGGQTVQRDTSAADDQTRVETERKQQQLNAIELLDTTYANTAYEDIPLSVKLAINPNLTPKSLGGESKATYTERVNRDAKLYGQLMSAVKTTGMFGSVTGKTAKSVELANAIWGTIQSPKVVKRYEDNPSQTLAWAQNHYAQAIKIYERLKKIARSGSATQEQIKEAQHSRQILINQFGYDPEVK